MSDLEWADADELLDNLRYELATTKQSRADALESKAQVTRHADLLAEMVEKLGRRLHSENHQRGPNNRVRYEFCDDMACTVQWLAISTVRPHLLDTLRRQIKDR